MFFSGVVPKPVDFPVTPAQVWRGIGAVARGMAHQGYDIQLTRYDARDSAPSLPRDNERGVHQAAATRANVAAAQTRTLHFNDRGSPEVPVTWV